MWNYTYVIPTFLVLVIFLGYYFLTPRIPIRINGMFLFLIAVESLVMFSDIISTWADMNYQSFPYWLLYFFNSLYFIAFFIRAVCFFMFTSLILGFLSDTYYCMRKTILSLPAFVVTVIVILAPWTHWFYYMDEQGYHSGPLYKLLYFIFLFYLLHSFILIFAFRDRFRNRRERNSTLYYNICLLLGIVMRYNFPEYLLMDTFCLMSIIIIYLTFENPDFYLEGRTLLFNATALRAYIREISGKKKYKILAAIIHNYSEVREIYGVPQMDKGIFLIGEYLKDTFPKQKIFYYRSGRFAIMFEDDKDKDYIEIYRRLQNRFNEPWKADDVELYVEVGASLFDPGDGSKLSLERITQLLIAAFKIADKSDGSSLEIIDEEYAERTKGEGDVKKALKYALENNGVEVFLQPIVDSKRRIIVGAEALARIRDANGNLIPPDLFIPIAERNGKINQLGEIVFYKICEFIRDYDIRALGLEWINVNLSPIQFMRADLGKRLMDFVRETCIDPNLIHLEITEATMVDEQLLEKQIAALKANGFCFVLDDYGKGYSNMSRLKNCPFINIKLDMSIVWDYCKSPDDMLPNMVKTFSEMGFEITAEGVENEKIADEMESIGCNYLQGYHYSKPIPMNEFVALVKKA